MAVIGFIAILLIGFYVTLLGLQITIAGSVFKSSEAFIGIVIMLLGMLITYQDILHMPFTITFTK